MLYGFCVEREWWPLSNGMAAEVVWQVGTSLLRDVACLVKFYICLSVLKSRQEYIIFKGLCEQCPVSLKTDVCVRWQKMFKFTPMDRLGQTNTQISSCESSDMTEPIRQRQEKRRHFIRCSVSVCPTQISIYQWRWSRQERAYEGESTNLLHFLHEITTKK